uniref:(northern house mosquito) hypothetical protein n=1 Tax=Culex pipiens TaxID=7175 RepID=A0A8D8JYH7_CULPI
MQKCKTFLFRSDLKISLILIVTHLDVLCEKVAGSIVAALMCRLQEHLLVLVRICWLRTVQEMKERERNRDVWSSVDVQPGTEGRLRKLLPNPGAQGYSVFPIH